MEHLNPEPQEKVENQIASFGEVDSLQVDYDYPNYPIVYHLFRYSPMGGLVTYLGSTESFQEGAISIAKSYAGGYDLDWE